MAQKPTLRQLKYLCALADERHFGKAAKRCHVTQSTLSAGIQELERCLGVALIERGGKHVLLTAAGQSVTHRSRHILLEVEALAEEAASALAPFRRPIRLGVIPTIAPFLLPSALAALRKDHPGFQLLIREDLSDRLVQLLFNGELDVLLMALLSGRQCHNPSPARRSLSGRPSKGTCPERTQSAADPPSEGPRSSATGTRSLPTRPGAGSLQTPERGGLLSLKPPVCTLVPMVANRIGITLLPKMAIDQGILAGIDNIEVRPFSGQRVARSIDLLWRKHSPRQAEYRLLGNYLAPTPLDING